MAPQAKGTRGGDPARAERDLIAKLFVYGSLMPEHEAWPVLERWTTGAPRRDSVAGVLFDTGRGYPCATFASDAPDVVHGVVVDLDPARLDVALTTLDAYEASEYDRVVVRTQGGEDAHTYVWVASLDRCTPVAGGLWTG